MSKFRRIIPTLCCLLLAEPILAGQKPTAPVDITPKTISTIRQGEEATATITFRAEANLERLEISVEASDGVTLVADKPEATFDGVKRGDAHSLEVKIRLNAPWGFISAFATATTHGDQERTKVASLLVGTREKASVTNSFDPEEDLSRLTFMNSNGLKAVVRFAGKPLRVVSVGDHLGKNKAEVKAIEADRLVLEETYIGPDGRPNKAQIILKKGETGGTRYLQRPDNDAPPARRPVPVAPTGSTLRK